MPPICDAMLPQTFSAATTATTRADDTLPPVGAESAPGAVLAQSASSDPAAARPTRATARFGRPTMTVIYNGNRFHFTQSARGLVRTMRSPVTGFPVKLAERGLGRGLPAQ